MSKYDEGWVKKGNTADTIPASAQVWYWRGAADEAWTRESDVAPELRDLYEYVDVLTRKPANVTLSYAAANVFRVFTDWSDAADAYRDVRRLHWRAQFNRAVAAVGRFRSSWYLALVLGLIVGVLTTLVVLQNV